MDEVLDPTEPTYDAAPTPPVADNSAATAAPPLPHGPAAMKEVGDAFKDPRALTAIAATYLKNGSKAGLAFLERAHNAAQENIYEAIGHLDINDGEGAVAAFNRSGKFSDATGATKNPDGTWTISRSGGPAVTFDADQLKRSLLSPKDYLAQQAKEKEAAAQSQYYAAHARQADAMAGYYGNLNETRQTIADLTNQSKELQKQIGAVPGMLKAEREGADKEFSQKYGLAAFLKDRAAQYVANPVPDPSDPDGKRMLPPDAAALLDALRSRPDLVDYKQDPKTGMIVAVNRRDPSVVLKRFRNAQEMVALGIQPDQGVAAPPPKQPGFLERNLPYFGGTSAPKPPPASRAPAQGLSPDFARAREVAADPTKAQTGDFAQKQAQAVKARTDAANDPELKALAEQAAQQRKKGDAKGANNTDARAAQLRQQRYGF